MMGITDNPVVGDLAWIGVAALPYILLRLVDDFRPQPTWVMLLAPLAFLSVAVVGVAMTQPWPVPVSLLLVTEVVAFGGYSSVAFLREAGQAQGVTRRRMQAVALGSGLLALIILLAGVQLVVPATASWIGLASQTLGLATVVSYFLGFAPPMFLRRAWQEPALRGLMADATDLVQLADPYAIASRIEESAIAATGAQGHPLDCGTTPPASSSFATGPGCWPTSLQVRASAVGQIFRCRRSGPGSRLVR